MTQKELAEMYGIKPHKGGLKDKRKATEIVKKILTCHKCGGTMRWIENTNQCVCDNCTYSVGKSEKRHSLSVTKSISDKNRKFLEDNYSSVLLRIGNEQKQNLQNNKLNDKKEESRGVENA